MTLSAREIAVLAEGRLVGDGDLRCSGIAEAGTASRTDLIFVEDQKFLPQALASAAGVLLAGPFAEGATFHGALITCPQPRLAFARAGRRLYGPGGKLAPEAPQGPPSTGALIHQTAVLHPSSTLGRECVVGPHAVVDEEVVMGHRVVLGPGVHVGRGVQVGDDTIIKANVVIYPFTTIGARVIVHAGTVLGSDGFGYVRDAVTGRYEAFPQVGRLVIEDDVELGALCTVDRGALGATTIRRGTKLDNQVHVAHNVEIGQDVVIAAQTGIAGSSVIEDRAVIAGQVGIADHVRVGEGAILGAQCGVPTGKVLKGAGVLFWGTPARPIRQYLKELAILARMAKK